MSTPAEPSRGSIRLTPPRALALGAAVGAVGATLLVLGMNALDLTPPQVPWTAPAALLLTAALVGFLARTTHQRIQVRRERVPAERAVAFLVLGKASALAGAVVVGGYLAFALLFVSRIEAEAPRERVVRSAVAVVAGAALSATGLLLERACRVPGVDDEDETAD